MYEFTCKGCGKRVVVRLKSDVTAYCGNECLTRNRSKHCKHIDYGERSENPVRDIHPTGYDNLVQAICQRAADDVLNFRPGNWLRKDAEHFFLSGYFDQLTGLDGFEVLYKLSQIYEENQRKKRRKTPDEHGE